MKNSTKALIYSAFIFPGAGYFILNHKPKAYSFAAITGLCLIFILFDSAIKANTLAQQWVDSFTHRGILETQALIQNLSVLPQYMREQLLIIEGPLPANVVTGLTGVLIIVWLAGLVGCYYHGKQTP